MKGVRKLKLEELGRPDIEEFKALEKAPVCIVLDNIRSGLNVGSVFRTADAFLIQKIFLCGITAQPPNKEILKTAIGATASVDWEYHHDILSVVQFLKNDGYHIIAIEQTNMSVDLIHYLPDRNEKYALIFGNEVEGVSSEILDFVDDFIEINQFGTKHSLNIAVCAGIVLFEFSKQFLEK